MVARRWGSLEGGLLNRLPSYLGWSTRSFPDTAATEPGSLSSSVQTLMTCRIQIANLANYVI